jgi:hypothetical protein
VATNDDAKNHTINNWVAVQSERYSW